MGFSKYMMGQEAQDKKLSLMGGDQQGLQSTIMQHLQRLLDPDMQKQLGGAAATQFQQQTLPSLSERFTSLGISPDSTGAFGQQVAQAQQGMLGQLLGQQQQQMASLMPSAFQSQFENIHNPREEGMLEKLLMGLLTSGGESVAKGLGAAGSAMASGGGNMAMSAGNMAMNAGRKFFS